MSSDSLGHSPLSSPATRQVFAFTLCYMAVAAVGAITRGNAEFIYYLVVMLVLIPCVAVVHARVMLTTGTLWCLSLWGLLHMAGGLVRAPGSWPIAGEQHVLYSVWLIPNRLKYDQVIHAYGFGVTTWVCWQGLQVAVKARGSLQPTFGLMVLCVAAGMGFGALNEVIEFAATLLLADTNVGGYLNTGWDLVANFTGCIVAALCIRQGWRSP